MAATSDMMSPISLQSNRIATTALAPGRRASRHMRSRAWLRLSVSSLVYPATSPPASVRSCAPILLKALQGRTISPNTSPWTWLIR
jgi:hypothetical protein